MSISNKIAIIYAYYEKDNTYITNLNYFLKLGIYPECDYYFIINGICSVIFPNQNNIKVMRRENEGFDFGGYYHALNNMDKNKYDYFIFMNTSVRGPFLPNYISIKWYEPFLNLIKDDVKLVGPTINIYNLKNTDLINYIKTEEKFETPYPHVQTQLFAMDKECLLFLIEKKIFDKNTYTNLRKIMALKEILMSLYVLKNNWNISCLIPEYQNIDYRTIQDDINPTSYNNDCNLIQGCFGRTIHPYESIFVKVSRFICFNNGSKMDIVGIDSLSKYYLENSKVI